MTRYLIYTALIAWLCLPAPLALAADDPTDQLDVAQLTTLTADEVTYDQTAGHAVATGHVRVVNGDLTLTAQRVTATYGPDGNIRTLTAHDSVHVSRGGQTASSDRAVFDIQTGLLRMTGQPVLCPAPGVRLTQADAVEYSREDGKLRATGRPTITHTSTPTDPKPES